ncbi:hypothetical protein FC52_GL001615 [Lactobacillus pasteurii DSM 23907 = CRBIP 24.76]|uniref:Uncharacterized protein n=1 Tax=Lactobacillus pasteurii DSM 23907 = CRBIP 24.76 TaxID=1423790 RepID=I7JXL0_9LACO|nr:hypothetical protein [Lactobacillus pasteurii]KRK07725.1 hypothetical protein FC52_GL001615 [Lactobacillus pasteurii DSM 23907 = CRBIP 24.76]TDG77735.1 hypothetical protein C5L33_000146 [Lactobacillus pasteurii]CCI84735.1 Protein of unknown function [Lactobacillus pasteurii DSM 23907 = CRBIP 24.76]
MSLHLYDISTDNSDIKKIVEILHRYELMIDDLYELIEHLDPNFDRMKDSSYLRHVFGFTEKDEDELIDLFYDHLNDSKDITLKELRKWCNDKGSFSEKQIDNIYEAYHTSIAKTFEDKNMPKLNELKKLAAEYIDKDK